jgi:hypothetical protein
MVSASYQTRRSFPKCVSLMRADLPVPQPSHPAGLDRGSGLLILMRHPFAPSTWSRTINLVSIPLPLSGAC